MDTLIGKRTSKNVCILARIEVGDLTGVENNPE